jgi:tetratricopeptide (TPR) repeat protein
MSRRPSSALVAAVAALAVLVIGGLIAVDTGGGDQSAAAAADDGGFRRLFDEGVDLMRQGRPHEAAVVFAAARMLRPDITEVSANLGFALMAQGDNQSAVAVFDRALEMNPKQLNAYYGLAVALEASGDIEGALGAMRAYIHLEDTESPFHRKASAAVWEWEDRLRRQREGIPAELPPELVTADGMPAKSVDDIRRDMQGGAR